VRASDAVAILTSDWQLHHIPPKARNLGGELGVTAWFDCMDRAMGEIYDLALECKCPVIIAGDVFDRHSAPPTLINFAIARIRAATYAVRGNHDCPNGQYDAIHRSAYWTLVQAGKVIDLTPERQVNVGSLVLYGAPHGCDIPKAQSNQQSLCLHVAVIHAFVWTQTTGYEGAPDDKRLTRYVDKLCGYHVALFGDNHKPFDVAAKKNLPTVCNAGPILCRTEAERTFRPSVGLLFSDGSVVRYYLDISKDRWVGRDNSSTATRDGVLDLGEFAAAIEKSQRESGPQIDFGEALSQYCESNAVDSETRAAIMDVYEQGKSING
jgi:hypothetical protein